MMRKLIVAMIAVVCVLVLSNGQARALGKTKYFYKKGSGSWVKIAKGNKKQGPFEHPYKITAADLERALGSLQYFKPGFFSVNASKGKEYALFTEEEIKLLVEWMVPAFAEAGADQWVDFSVQTFRGQTFIGTWRQTDGVVFVKGGKLNVALRNIAVKVNMDDTLSTYDPTKGYRAFSKLAATEGQTQVGDNWVSMDAANIAKLKTMKEIEEAKIELADDKKDPPPEPPKPAKERLLELQELYDQGLISEQEYQKKREEILKEL